MSQTDSFIEEVSEEVRRDRLFGFFRKYAWAFAAIVILIVGGAALNEYLKAKAEREAQAAGEAFRAAIEASSAEAFVPLADTDAPYAVIARMDEAAILSARGDTAAAAELLDSIASDSGTPALYRDLALLKLVMVNGENMPEAELFDILDKLAAEGAPFRLLGMEQRAIANLRKGDSGAAMGDLVQILVDPNATQGLRNRVEQLTIAIGGDMPALLGVPGEQTNDG